MNNKQKLLSASVFFIDELQSEELLTLGDKLTIPASKRELRDSGMIAPCTIARTGVMNYRARDLGDLFSDREPDSIVKVMTAAEELFATDSIESYRSCPITFKHPRDENGKSIDVSLDNNKDLQKGMLEGLPFRDGPNLAGTIVVNDQETIGLVDEGYDQLSSGHKAVVVRVEGKAWDAEKTKIRANHIAIVKNGRAQTARIADDDDGIPEPGEEIVIVPEPKPEPEPKPSTLTDVSVLQAMLDDFEERNTKLTNLLSEAATKLKDTEENLVTVSGQLRTVTDQNESLKTQLADEKTKNVSDEEFKRRVEEHAASRIELLSQIAKLGDDFDGLELKGKTELDIKRDVLSRLYDGDFTNRDEGYINARFDMALSDSTEITLSDALSTSMLSKADPQKKTYVNPAAEAKARRAARYNK